MLTEIYVEALLVDEELADQVWDARNHSWPGTALSSFEHALSA